MERLTNNKKASDMSILEQLKELCELDACDFDNCPVEDIPCRDCPQRRMIERAIEIVKENGMEQEDKRAEKEARLVKPIIELNFGDEVSKYHCSCGKVMLVSHDPGVLDNNDAPNYCSNCGCRFDWSDEE